MIQNEKNKYLRLGVYFCGIGISYLFLSGCATMVRGTTQQVSVNSDPTGANVTFSNGTSCTTSCTIEAQRKTTLQVTMKHEGCNTYSSALVPTLAGAGAVLGGVIDYGTGAVYDLQPNPLFVTMNCDGKGPSAEEELERLKKENAKLKSDANKG